MMPLSTATNLNMPLSTVTNTESRASTMRVPSFLAKGGVHRHGPFRWADPPKSFFENNNKSTPSDGSWKKSRYIAALQNTDKRIYEQILRSSTPSKTRRAGTIICEIDQKSAGNKQVGAVRGVGHGFKAEINARPTTTTPGSRRSTNETRGSENSRADTHLNNRSWAASERMLLRIAAGPTSSMLTFLLCEGWRREGSGLRGGLSRVVEDNDAACKFFPYRGGRGGPDVLTEEVLEHKEYYIGFYNLI
jgi:hypothetical protein